MVLLPLYSQIMRVPQLHGSLPRYSQIMRSSGHIVLLSWDRYQEVLICFCPHLSTVIPMWSNHWKDNNPSIPLEIIFLATNICISYKLHVIRIFRLCLLFINNSYSLQYNPCLIKYWSFTSRCTCSYFMTHSENECLFGCYLPKIPEQIWMMVKSEPTCPQWS